MPGFVLEFVEAVPGEACRTRKRTEQHAGDVLDDLQLDETQREEFGRCAGLARPANRRVLGCLLANLRAMRVVCERRNALIVEDNVRPLLEDASQSVLKVLDDACDLLYLGHLAHADTLQRIPRGLSDAPQLRRTARIMSCGAPTPTGPLPYCIRLYSNISETASPSPYSIVEGGTATSSRSTSSCSASLEGEWIYNKVPRAAGLLPHAAGPTLQDPPEVGRGLRGGVAGQLALYGLAWRDVWLTPAERAMSGRAGGTFH